MATAPVAGVFTVTIGLSVVAAPPLIETAPGTTPGVTVTSKGFDSLGAALALPTKRAWNS